MQLAMTFPYLFRCAMHTHPNKVALKEDESGEQWTFGDIASRANRLSRALVALGIGARDRVAILSRNTPFFVEQYYAITQIGAVAVPLNFRLTAFELGTQLGDARPIAVIFDSEFFDLVKQLQNLNNMVKYWIGSDSQDPSIVGYQKLMRSEHDDTDLPFHNLTADAPCAILFTAGTTGRAKGAVRSHQAVVWTIFSYALGLKTDAESVYVGVPPFFHIAGSECTLFPVLMQGGTAITMRHFEASRFLHVVESERATHLFVVPSMAIQLLQQDWEPYDLRSVKVWFSASAPLPSVIRESLRQSLPGISLINGIGSTEASPIANLTTEYMDGKPGHCVGKSWLGSEVAVMDDLGNMVPANVVGNLAVQTMGTMTGYLDNEEATTKAFTGSWYLTGDLAFKDADGFVHLVDRKRDMIISGGENIYAAEVEDAIYRVPGVAEVAVVGKAHPLWGEVPVAFVVRKVQENVTESDILAQCHTHLASYKTPKEIIFVDSLPRNTFGKVMKWQLRDHYRMRGEVDNNGHIDSATV
ncbi:MAG: hypothetical protein C7B46_06840 [Sulfobacillus benefaciens]|uniref:AMP-dependent synthetase n=1 Tax=Sulfobacillus benefaciens TaxID=453960 RepID=A0A2T2XHZ8_9FIRM|nr:MAG: hypothetical protein C7B46_06840 [Sulfobacillus benefaciens]